MADTTPTLPRLVSPSGEVVELRDPSLLAAAKEQGYLLASPEQSREYDLKLKYGGTGGALKAFGLGVGRGATFGLSDVAARGLGMSAEDLAGYKEANETASTLGEASGIAGSLFLPFLGEANAAKAGAEAADVGLHALSPAAQVARAGRAVTTGVEHVLPEATGTLGKIARHAVASGAGMATEGAAYGLGHEVTEAALGDPNQTASSVIQHVGLAALMGGGLGAAMGGGIEGALASLEKAGATSAALKDKLKEFYPELVEQMTGIKAEHTQALMEARAVTREAQIEALKGTLPKSAAPEAIDGVLRPPKEWATEVGGHMQDLFDRTVQLAKWFNKEIRPDEIENLAAGINTDAAKTASVGVRNHLENLLVNMESEEGLFPASYRAKVGQAIDMLEGVENLPAAEQFQQVIKARQVVDTMTKLGRDASDLERYAVPHMRKMASLISDVTKDEGVWGEIGARQARLNAAKAAWEDAQEQFRKDFFGTGKRRFQANPAKWEPFLQNMDAPKYTFQRESLANFIKAAEEYHGAIKDSALNARRPFDASSLTDLTDKSQDLIAKVRQAAAQQEQLAQHAEVLKAHAASEAERELTARGILTDMAGPKAGVVGSILDMVGTGGLLTSILHHTPGGAVLAVGAKLAKKVLDVPGTVGVLSKLEGMNKAVEGTMKRAADAAVRGGERLGIVGRAEAEAGIGRVHDKPLDEQRAIYRKLMDRVNHLSDPQVQMDHLAQATQELAPHAPQTAQGVMTKTSSAVQYLKQTSPDRDPKALLDQKHEPNATELARWFRRFEAIDDPTSLLKKAGNGTLTKEHVDAVAAVHPELLQAMRTQILNSLASYKGIVPMSARNGLSLLLGQPVTSSRSAASLQATAGLYKSVGQTGPQGPNPTASKASKLNVAQRVSEGTTSQPRQKV